MRIYLIGYMASGKSRIGKQLSSLSGFPFIDTDELFESKYRISILDFFERYNELSFRKIEKDILAETLSYPDAIIATGGGTPCFFNNMDMIRSNGISIYLKMDVRALVSRLVTVRKKRPLLKDKKPDELESYVKAQLAEREPFYMMADYVVDVLRTDPEKIWNLIRTSST
jgi:shikimate kinase